MTVACINTERNNKMIDILTMPAGREMDALIWMALHNQEPNISMCRFVDGDYQPHAGYPIGHISPPNYSTDIAAAWEVVNRLHPDFSISLGFDDPATIEEIKWCCELYAKDEPFADFEARADTAPLAICRAAYLAKKGITK